MTKREMLRGYFAGHDAEGNRLGRRELPDGSTCEIVKNFPTKAQLESQTGEHFSNFQYYLFPELERWIIICGL
ncbi:MAG: hypothetical protein P1R58_05340 [bacterium]|nr:hypothetical protein [bacterium]